MVGVATLSHGAEATRTWMARSVNVEPHDYGENGDPFRAARITVAAGQRPDPHVRRPALTGPTTEHLRS